MKLIANIDGGSRGNPGPSAIGVVISGFPDNGLDLEYSEYIGTATNNEAEYLALLAALRYAVSNQAQSLLVRSDSQLVVRQVQGTYTVHNSRLHALHKMALQMIGLIPQFSITHIPREENAQADRLCNEALDEFTKEGTRVPNSTVGDAPPIQNRVGAYKQRWTVTDY